jgi:hypothetical protein
VLEPLDLVPDERDSRPHSGQVSAMGVFPKGPNVGHSRFLENLP